MLQMPSHRPIAIRSPLALQMVYETVVRLTVSLTIHQTGSWGGPKRAVIESCFYDSLARSIRLEFYSVLQLIVSRATPVSRDTMWKCSHREKNTHAPTEKLTERKRRRAPIHPSIQAAHQYTTLWPVPNDRCAGDRCTNITLGAPATTGSC